MTTKSKSQRKVFAKFGLSVIMVTATMLLPASAQSQKPTPQPQNSQPIDGIYSFVQVLPSFPGGVKEFMNYLSQNLKYPAADKEKHISGKVVARFVVERDGSLTNIKIVRSPADDMSKEAVRVLSSSPKWVPGKQDGKPVRAYYTIPINFAINGN